MFKTVVAGWSGCEMYSAFFSTREEAVAYAERMPGVIRVDGPDGETVWSR